MHSARKILSDSDRMMKVVLKRNNNNKIGKRNVIARHTMCVDKADPYFSFERQQMNVNFMEHIEVQYYFIGLVFRCRFIKAILTWFVRRTENVEKSFESENQSSSIELIFIVYFFTNTRVIDSYHIRVWLYVIWTYRCRLHSIQFICVFVDRLPFIYSICIGNFSIFHIAHLLFVQCI